MKCILSLLQKPQVHPTEIPYSALGPTRIRVGKGGSGDVYKTTYKGDTVVIKRYNYHTLPKFSQNEYEALSRLKPHANIIRFIGYAFSEDCRLLVLPLISGKTLGKYAEKQAPNFSQTLAFHRIFFKLAAALNHVHSQRVIHGDFNADNVLMTPRGEPILIDFDLAKFLPPNEDVALDSPGVGHMGHIAPECFLAKTAPYSTASDYYAFGITLALVAMNAVSFYDLDAYLAQFTGARYKAPPQIPEALPTATKNLLTGLWSLKPEDRPSGEKVMGELQRSLTIQRSLENGLKLLGLSV